MATRSSPPQGNGPAENSLRPAKRAAVGKIVLIYALFAGLWILISDHVLRLVAIDPEMQGRLSVAKGWFFVAITSGLLYSLLRLDRRRLEQAVASREATLQALHESNVQLHWLEDNLPGSYVYQYVLGSDGRPAFVHISAGVEKIHLVSAAQVIADSDILHRQIGTEHLAGLKEAQAASLDTLGDFEQELRIIRPDGETRWVQVRARPWRRADGQVVWDGVTTDVTEQKRAGEARRESEERLRALVALMPDALFINQDNQVVFANARALQLWGAENEGQLLGRSPYDLFHSEVHAEMRARITQLLKEGGTLPRAELIIVRLDGVVTPVETTAAIFTFGGRPAIQVVVRDITERKKAEEKLRLQEAVLRETGRIAQVGGWTLEIPTGEVYWTEEVARLHDLEADAPTSRAIGLSYYAGESRRRLEAAMDAAVQTGAAYDLELEMTSAKGVRRWVRTIGHPIVENGRVMRLHGSFQDISERHRMDEERERQQRRLALLADLSQRLVLCESTGAVLESIFADLARELQVDIFANYMVSPAGDRLLLNGSGGLTEEQRRDFAELPFGVSLCGLVAQRRERLVFADLPTATVPQAAGIIALGVKAYAGHPLLAGGRLIGTISFGSRQKEHYTEDDLRLMNVVTDQVAAAVERHRLLSELKDSEVRFRQMAESIDEVFWMTDTSKANILYVSPAYEKIWGRSREALYAEPTQWLDAIVPEDQERVIQALALQATGNYRVEYRINRPDGTIRWIYDRGFPVRDERGQAYRVVGSAQDISERKSLEAQFLRAQRLEAVGTLAGGVAHDLNNILAPVLMVTGLLRDKLGEAHDQQLLTLVEASAKRGAAIIRQLLTFSRGIEGARISVQLRHLIKDMVHLMQETFPRNLEIHPAVAGDLWTVTAEATQMHQVLMNLCVNARDAMPEGGRLTVGADNVQLDAVPASLPPEVQPGRYVVVTVADTGTGIPAAVIDRIFEPFFSTKDIGKGTGLGLSTVMGIVKSHGGFVTVESPPGRGTTFRVHLPAAAGEAPVLAGETAPPPVGQGELILVVDDEPAVREATCRNLERGHYRVLGAADGREAVGLFLQHQDSVRLVVTDLMMPVMSGPALIRALQSIKPELAMVATTGLDQEDRIGEVEALGVRHILHKPCTHVELLWAVGRALEDAARRR